jgi:hypothetical protein
MTEDKVLEVIATYRARFEEMGIKKETFPHDQDITFIPWRTGILALEHCHSMLDQMETFVADHRMDKVFRWLGFVQCALWLQGLYTLDDLKEHNR